MDKQFSQKIKRQIVALGHSLNDNASRGLVPEDDCRLMIDLLRILFKLVQNSEKNNQPTPNDAVIKKSEAG